MLTIKLQKDIEIQLKDAVERYHLDRNGLLQYMFGFFAGYPNLSVADFEQIFEHITTQLDLF